jgi:hypothetical protein
LSNSCPTVSISILNVELIHLKIFVVLPLS